MRKPVLLIFANACILIIVFVLLAQSLFVVHRVALARSVVGEVEVQRDGAGPWQTLATGGNINSGDIVRTAANGWAEFAWQDGTRWKLWPQSRFTIQKAQINPIKKSEISQFELESGKVLVRVVKPLSAASSFDIKTPTAAATVRGTIFCVAHEKMETKVKVYRGNVDVSNPNRPGIMHVPPGYSGRAYLLDNVVEIEPDQSEFSSHPDFLQPYLQAEVELLDAQTALLKGQTEVGNKLTVGGMRVPVLGTGHFRQRVKIGGANPVWKIQSTDKHGASTVLLQRLPTPYDTKPQ